MVKIGKTNPTEEDYSKVKICKTNPTVTMKRDNGRAHSAVCGKISSVAHCGDRVIVWTTNEPRRT